MANNERCPHCGMELSLGSDPTERNGKTYCCRGCADETGCTC